MDIYRWQESGITLEPTRRKVTVTDLISLS